VKRIIPLLLLLPLLAASACEFDVPLGPPTDRDGGDNIIDAPDGTDTLPPPDDALSPTIDAGLDASH
jgi:hypothetical protein